MPGPLRGDGRALIVLVQTIGQANGLINSNSAAQIATMPCNDC